MICIFAGLLVEVRLLYADVEKQKPQLLCVWRIGGECCKEMCGRNLVERIGGKWSFHTSEALTSYLGRIEAETEVMFRLLHLCQLVMLLGWQHFYSVTLVFMLLV